MQSQLQDEFDILIKFSAMQSRKHLSPTLWNEKIPTSEAEPETASPPSSSLGCAGNNFADNLINWQDSWSNALCFCNFSNSQNTFRKIQLPSWCFNRFDDRSQLDLTDQMSDDNGRITSDPTSSEYCHEILHLFLNMEFCLRIMLIGNYANTVFERANWYRLILIRNRKNQGFENITLLQLNPHFGGRLYLLYDTAVNPNDDRQICRPRDRFSHSDDSSIAHPWLKHYVGIKAMCPNCQRRKWLLFNPSYPIKSIHFIEIAVTLNWQ